MEDVGRDVLIYLWDNYVQKVQSLKFESLHDLFLQTFKCTANYPHWPWSWLQTAY